MRKGDRAGATVGVVGLALLGVILLLPDRFFGGIDAEPSDLPPLPSPSASSPAPLPQPTGTDVQQIKALAWDYFEERNRALNTGDTARLRAMSTPDCNCLAFAKYVEDKWKNGRIEAPGYYNLQEVTYPTARTPTTGFANIVYTLGAEVHIDASGHRNSAPANPKIHSSSLEFRKIDGIWKVSEVLRNVD